MREATKITLTYILAATILTAVILEEDARTNRAIIEELTEVIQQNQCGGED